MHNYQNTRKAVSAGTLVGRAFFICLAFLIIPLFIHSFFQYRKEIELERQEIQLQERDIRATLRAIGEQMVQRVEDFIELDWAILNTPASGGSLEEIFDFHRITIVTDVPDQFVLVDEEKAELLVGKKVSETRANVIVHPLADVIALKSPPFPIQVGLNEQVNERWVEDVAIPKTNLHLSLGTHYTGISHLHPDHFLLRIISFILITGLLGGGLVYLLLKKLARPLNVLRLTMERVADGAVYSRYVNQRFGFEINAIGQYFNETVDALLAQQKQAEIEKIHRERLAEKLQVAQTIQADLLPKKIPTVPHLQVDAAFQPALEVGGDFYDLLPLSNGKVLLVVADIADKGVSACLFSLGLRSSLRALAESTGGNISDMVKKANELFLLDAEETSQFATVWLGVLDGKMLSFISLGHPAALLKRDGEVNELSTNHPSLGLTHFSEIHATNLQLLDGDELLIFSDGVTESHDAENLLYGNERLQALFSKSKGINVAQLVLEDIQSFSHGAAQHDDITLLSVTILP